MSSTFLRRAACVFLPVTFSLLASACLVPPASRPVSKPPDAGPDGFGVRHPGTALAYGRLLALDMTGHPQSPGRWIENVRIDIWGSPPDASPGMAFTAITGRDGAFAIPNVPAAWKYSYASFVLPTGGWVSFKPGIIVPAKDGLVGLGSALPHYEPDNADNPSHLALTVVLPDSERNEQKVERGGITYRVVERELLGNLIKLHKDSPWAEVIQAKFDSIGNDGTPKKPGKKGRSSK